MEDKKRVVGTPPVPPNLYAKFRDDEDRDIYFWIKVVALFIVELESDGHITYYLDGFAERDFNFMESLGHDPHFVGFEYIPRTPYFDDAHGTGPGDAVAADGAGPPPQPRGDFKGGAA